MKLLILAAICILALVPMTIHADQPPGTNCAVREAFDHDGNVVDIFEFPCRGIGGCTDCTPPSIGQSSFRLQWSVPNGLRFNFEPVPLVDYNITE